MSDDFYGEEPEESYAFYPGFEAVESRPVNEELEDEMNKQATESSKPYDGSIPGVNWAALEVRGQPKDTRDTRKAIVAIKRREFDDEHADNPDKPQFKEKEHGWFNWNVWPFYQTLWADKEAGNTRNDARIARIAAKKALEKVPKETFDLDKNKVHQIEAFKFLNVDARPFGGKPGQTMRIHPYKLGEYEEWACKEIDRSKFPQTPEGQQKYDKEKRMQMGVRKILDADCARRNAAAAEEEERRAAAAAEEEEKIANQPGGDDFVGYPEEDGFGGGRKRRRKNRKKKTKKRRYKKKTKKRKNKSRKKTRKSKRRKQTIKRKR